MEPCKNTVKGLFQSIESLPPSSDGCTSVVIDKYLDTDESAIEGQRKAGSREQLRRVSPAGQRGEPLNAASLLGNRVLLPPSGVRAQGAVSLGTAPLAPPC